MTSQEDIAWLDLLLSFLYRGGYKLSKYIYFSYDATHAKVSIYSPKLAPSSQK